MTPVTLYTIQAHEVELADGFTASRQPGNIGLVHYLPDGDALIGMRQMPMDSVQKCDDGSYIALASKLREILEAPILANSAMEVAHYREQAWLHFVGAPLWLRIWRALTC